MIQKLIVFVLLCVFMAAMTRYPVADPKSYVVYGTMKCPYTVKMVEELKSKNMEYEFVDISTKEGNAAFSKAAPNVGGVPFTVNKITGESFLGYRVL